MKKILIELPDPVHRWLTDLQKEFKEQQQARKSLSSLVVSQLETKRKQVFVVNLEQLQEDLRPEFEYRDYTFAMQICEILAGDHGCEDDGGPDIYLKMEIVVRALNLTRKEIDRLLEYKYLILRRWGDGAGVEMFFYDGLL